jgi:hypothetical protein
VATCSTRPTTPSSTKFVWAINPQGNKVELGNHLPVNERRASQTKSASRICFVGPRPKIPPRSGAAVNLLVFGLGALFLGWGGRSGLRTTRRLLLIKGMSASSIASATGGGMVLIKGKIIAGEEVLSAPFGSGPAVWAHVWLETGSGKNSSTLVDAAQGRPFYIDDGSGQLARILPDDADVEVEGSIRSGSFSDSSKLAGLTDFVGFERAVRLPSTTSLGFKRNFSYKERVLAPGDSVLAMGPARRETSPPSDDHDRLTQTMQLTLRTEPHGQGRLLVSTQSEAQLIASLTWQIALSVVAIALGLWLARTGLVAR